MIIQFRTSTNYKKLTEPNIYKTHLQVRSTTRSRFRQFVKFYSKRKTKILNNNNKQ